MTTKKILAGVLAAASVLSVSATAFAAPAAPDKTKPVTAPGESEYEVSAVPMSATLDVVLPASMKAFLNPYGAEVTIKPESAANAGDAKTSKNGIVSWAYEIQNKTTDFGIFVDVKNAKATVSKGIELKSTADTLVGKQAAVALMAAADAGDIGNAAKMPTATAKATETTQGGVVFTTEAQSKSKIAYVPAADATHTVQTVYMGITGKIGTVDGDGEDVEWTADDSVTTSFILKINPAAKTAAQAFAAGGTPTPAAGNAKLTADAVSLTGLTGVTWDPDTTSYTSTATYGTGGTYTVQIDQTKLTATQTVSIDATTDDTGMTITGKTNITSTTSAANARKLMVDIANNGAGDGGYCEFTITVEDSSDSSTKTYTILVGTK